MYLRLLPLLLLFSPAWAAEPADLPAGSPAPVGGGSSEEQTLEPEVTIIQREDKTIEEYSVNGRVYMIRITPSRGFPYYLIDTDGDGSLETRRNDLDDRPINQWILFRW